MAKTITPEMFAGTVKDILAGYEAEVDKNMEQVTRKLAKEGAKAVKSAASSKFGGSGKYARGWTSEVQAGRIYSTGVIYNKTPGLPHLLENGHAMRGGGRVAGRPHIAPVEKEIVEEFISEVEAAL